MAEKSIPCDICCVPTLYSENVWSQPEKRILSGSKGCGVLNHHLFLYFTAAKLLKLSKEDALGLVAVVGTDCKLDGSDLKVVFSLCKDCENSVIRATKLHNQVVELQNEIDKLGRVLRGQVKSCRTDLSKHGSASVGQLLRNFLRPDSETSVKLEFENDFDDDFMDEHDTYEDFHHHTTGSNVKEEVNKNDWLPDSNENSDSDGSWEDLPQRRLKKHLGKHVKSSDGSFHCSLCESVYTTVPGIVKHKRMHSESALLGNLYDCTMCRHPNLSNSKLKRHMTKIHNVETTDETRESLEAPNIILKHFQTDNDDSYNIDPKVAALKSPSSPVRNDADTNQRPPNELHYPCSLCESPVVYTSRTGIHKHKRLHKESNLLGNKYDCPVCRHPAASESQLRRHTNTVHSGMQVKTQENPSDSIVESSLQKEAKVDAIKEQVSTYKGKHRCRLCKSVYNTVAGFGKHVQMHEKSKLLGNKFDCPVCQHPNLSHRSLRRHKSSAHRKRCLPTSAANLGTESTTVDEQTSIPESALEKPGNYPCKLCKSVYSGVSGIKKHKKMHEESELLGNMYDCSICKHPNLSDSKLRRHMTKVHGIHNKALGNRSTKAKRNKIDKDQMSDVDEEDAEDSGDVTLNNESQINDDENNYLYRCDVCNVGYKCARGLKRHEEDHRISLQIGHKYDCAECGFPASTKRRLNYHRQRAHFDPLACHICDQHMQGHEELKLHLKNHIKTSYRNRIRKRRKLIICKICKASYWYPKSYDMHMRDHEASKLVNGIWDCPVCLFPCQSKWCTTDEKKLDLHKKQRHMSAQQKLEQVTCNLCQKRFPESDRLKIHMRMHLECDDAYDPKTGLFVCNLCTYVGLNRRGLMRHKLSVHRFDLQTSSEEDLLCPHCGKTFFSSGSLRSHVRLSHENNRKYECKQCDKGFSSVNGLNLHKMTTHKDSRSRLKHICEVCGVAYLHYGTLKMHVARIHSSKAKAHAFGMLHKRKYPREKEHKCKWCDMIFSYKFMLRNHIPSAHQDLYTFSCNLCDKKYITGSSLKLHKETAHSDGTKSVACEYCQKIYAHRQRLACHYKHCREKRNLMT